MDLQLFTERSWCCMWLIAVDQQSCVVSVAHNRDLYFPWTSMSSSKNWGWGGGREGIYLPAKYHVNAKSQFSDCSNENYAHTYRLR